MYRTDEGDYWYEIILWDKTLYQPQEIYQTAYQAKAIGLSMIEVVIGY